MLQGLYSRSLALAAGCEAAPGRGLPTPGPEFPRTVTLGRSRWRRGTGLATALHEFFDVALSVALVSSLAA